MFILIGTAAVATIPATTTIIVVVVAVAVFEKCFCLTGSGASNFYSRRCRARVAADISKLEWFLNQLVTIDEQREG